MPYSEARKLFSEHVRSVAEGTKSRNVLSVAELGERFLEWIEKNRSPLTYQQKRDHLNIFGNFKVSEKMIFDLPADKVKGDDLEAFLTHRQKKHKNGANTRSHYQTSIKHCWNWATKHPSPTPYLSPMFRPFSAVERVYVPKKVLTEDDLITDDEIETVFAAARFDLDIFRFGLKVARDQNPYEDFADMLKCYYHTGARTGELRRVEVGDVLFRTKQVVLGNHKTSKTQRVQSIRRITLNDAAMEIFDGFCVGKNKQDQVFTTSDKKSWKHRSIFSRFVRVKEIAQKMDLGKVRDHISIYDFRHLWISEMLMAGNDVGTVARMAGTSIAMIESTYGHFRNEHLQEAQAKLDKARQERRG